jgi:excinuclease ABC subunit B
LYGIGNPNEFSSGMITIRKGQTIVRNKFLMTLVESLYSRNEIELNRGDFRVKGDTVDIFLAYADFILRVVFWGDEIDEIMTIEPANGRVIDEYDEYCIYPAGIFVTSKEKTHEAIRQIQLDLAERVAYFESIGKPYEAKRIYERVTYDMEMIKEVGYCSGIENYSRYFDGRAPGSRPFCLLDYFPKDYLMVIDESHVTVPQIRAMYGGDAARKVNLVEYGFRLPAAKDNRPLKFEEFEELVPQTIYVSATPADYELEKSEGVVVDQLIRPTGLLDPPIDVRPTLNQIDELHRVSKIAPVMCYGLKVSYTGELFPAIVKLMSLVEDPSEIKTTCSMCNSKATYSLLVRNGKPIYEGAFVNIEGENNEDSYHAVCREHFYEPVLD